MHMSTSNLTLDGCAMADDQTCRLSQAAAVSITFDKNAVERPYLILPEFADFDGLNVDTDVDVYIDFSR